MNNSANNVKPVIFGNNEPAALQFSVDNWKMVDRLEFLNGDWVVFINPLKDQTENDMELQEVKGELVQEVALPAKPAVAKTETKNTDNEKREKELARRRQRRLELKERVEAEKNAKRKETEVTEKNKKALPVIAEEPESVEEEPEAEDEAPVVKNYRTLTLQSTRKLRSLADLGSLRRN